MATTMTREELEAELEELRAQLAVRSSNRISFKVSDKTGALSIYGLNSRPVTLYRQQWERVLDHADELRAFIEANSSTLSVK